MPKKYIIRSFNPNKDSHKHVNPLINLSSLGINANLNILKTALGLSVSQTSNNIQAGSLLDEYYPSFYDAVGVNQFSQFRDLTKNSTNNYAFYDLSYALRRDYCRSLSRYGDMNFVLDTISNEAIVQDTNGFIAHLDVDRLKLFLNKSYTGGINDKTTPDSIIRDAKISYNTIYSALGWDKNNGAWSYYRKFLIEGFLAFEILLSADKKRITGFLELDAITLEPGIEIVDDKEVFIWYQYKGESRERKIPDSNLIYISWNNVAVSNVSNISYLETLTRSYNMLILLENSQLIWNIQNAQRRVKITVPVGDLSEAKAEARVSEIMAAYNEEVSMDDASGQLLVNGEPRFNFLKTFVFEDRGGASVGLEEVSAEGVDMKSTETLQYYWRRFILDTQIPANRFTLNIGSAPNNALLGDSTVTREEYAFRRFIQRTQSIFKEILAKPLWLELCLKHPELSGTNYLKQGIGIVFNEENLFTMAKERQMISDGASAISTLSGIMVSENETYFSIEYLIKKYLGLPEEELEINRKYKEGEILRRIEIAKLQKKHVNDKLANTPNADAGGMDSDGGGFGGSSDGGFDNMPNDVMDGGEFGGPSEPASNPEPADEGGFGE